MKEYSLSVRERFMKPQFSGFATSLTGQIRKSCVGQKDLGVMIVLSVAIDETGTVECAKFKVYGNPFVIAACDSLCESLVGRSLLTAPTVTARAMQQQLDAPDESLDSLIWVEKAYQQLIQGV